jgi:hypothetical protein
VLSKRNIKKGGRGRREKEKQDILKKITTKKKVIRCFN